MKSFILFAMIAVALLGAVPASAADWTRAGTGVPAGVVFERPHQTIDIDTKTVTYNDSVIFNGTTVQLLSDTPTVFGDTIYEYPGGGYDTGVSGYYELVILTDTPIYVNFNRVPRDATDGIPIAISSAIGANNTFRVHVPVVFWRTQSLCNGSTEMVSVIKFK